MLTCPVDQIVGVADHGISRFDFRTPRIAIVEDADDSVPRLAQLVNVLDKPDALVSATENDDVAADAAPGGKSGQEH